MQKNIFYIILVFCCMMIFLLSCMKDEMRPITEFKTEADGVFIVCEGNFMYGNASLSYYDINNKKIENTVFLKANGIPLGDVALSTTIYESKAYITINNSGKIFVFDINTFEITGIITGLVSPRHIRIISNSKGYISDLYSGSILVFNPSDLTITDTIRLYSENLKTPKYSSEQMIIYNDYLFTNSWSYSDVILVIDIKTDELIDSVKVLPQPRKMVLDKQNKLWVLCDGGFEGSSFYGESGIVKIDAKTFEVEKILFFEQGSNPTDMQINAYGDTIYYVNNHIYRFHINDKSLPETEYINSNNKNIFAIGISPYYSDLYVADAIDYMQSGKIYRYNSQKICVDSFNVGVIPNSFSFK